MGNYIKQIFICSFALSLCVTNINTLQLNDFVNLIAPTTGVPATNMYATQQNNNFAQDFEGFDSSYNPETDPNEQNEGNDNDADDTEQSVATAGAQPSTSSTWHMSSPEMFDRLLGNSNKNTSHPAQAITQGSLFERAQQDAQKATTPSAPNVVGQTVGSIAGSLLGSISSLASSMLFKNTLLTPLMTTGLTNLMQGAATSDPTGITAGFANSFGQATAASNAQGYASNAPNYTGYYQNISPYAMNTTPTAANYYPTYTNPPTAASTAQPVIVQQQPVMMPAQQSYANIVYAPAVNQVR